MTFNFSFNSNTHDFWGIYESIKKYYPIGLEQKEGKGIYYKYHGFKELEKIIVENIHDKDNYNDRWGDFTNKIAKELNREIESTTYGQAPSFSSSIILVKNKIGNCLHVKSLHFSVSLVGNYFQIYGLDTTTILDEKERKGYACINVITASPYEEFKESFTFMEKKLRERYPTYKIIPFLLGQTIINGLQVRYLNDENCSVNKALFNQFLSEENLPASVRGDVFYGKEDWVKN